MCGKHLTIFIQGDWDGHPIHPGLLGSVAYYANPDCIKNEAYPPFSKTFVQNKGGKQSVKYSHLLGSCLGLLVHNHT